MGVYEEKWRLMGLFFIIGKSFLHTGTSSLNPSLCLLLCVAYFLIHRRRNAVCFLLFVFLFCMLFFCLLCLLDFQFFTLVSLFILSFLI